MLSCGLLAGIVWIILGALVTALLGRDFAALPNNRLGAPTPGFLATIIRHGSDKKCEAPPPLGVVAVFRSPDHRINDQDQERPTRASHLRHTAKQSRMLNASGNILALLATK